MLKDRDYDVTPHIILIVSLTLTQNGRGVGECLRGVVWIWSAKSARCTVKMVDEEWEVGETLVVVSSGVMDRALAT